MYLKKLLAFYNFLLEMEQDKSIIVMYDIALVARLVGPVVPPLSISASIINTSVHPST